MPTDICRPGQPSTMKESDWRRTGEIVLDKNQHRALIFKKLIRCYRVACRVDKESDMAGTNKHAEVEMA